MAILITAPLGTGKTLYTIELMFEYLNQGRPVYSNIVGLKVVGVINVDSTSQNPFDWRDLPNDAVLFFDEAHEHPAFSERDLLRNFKIEYWENELKRISNLPDISDTKRKSMTGEIEKLYSKALKDEKEKIMDIGLSMSMHRHFGQEIILISQNPTKLNKDVLSNVTIHYVMRRKFGFEASNIWTFGEAMTTWGKSVADSALEKRYWRFPKHLYKFYVSSEKHNVKKYFPKKYFFYALIPFLILGKAFHSGSETGFFGLFKKDEKVTAPTIQPVEIQDGETRTQAQILEETAAQRSGMSLDQYRASQAPLTNLDFDCRKGENLTKPECVAWFDRLSQSNSSVTPQGQVVQTLSYDSDDPYGFEYKPQIQPKDFPRMSGVMTLPTGRLVAIDQQGNYMPNISQSDCKRWLQGYRPFDYLKSPNTSQNYAAQTQTETKEGII